MVDLGIKIVKRDHTYDLVDLQLQQLIENLCSIRRNKSSSCKFGSLLIFLFFYLEDTFPTHGQVNWKADQLVTNQITYMIKQVGANFNSLMTSYFGDFKKTMKDRSWILFSLVEEHSKSVYFLVDTDSTYVQAIVPRVKWLKAQPYEVDIDETSSAINALLAEDIDL